MLLASSVSLALPPGEPAAGISHELALWRAARYSRLQYAVRLELDTPFDRVRGNLVIALDTVNPDTDLVLDWRPADGARVWDIRVNGSLAGSVRERNDHLLIPRGLLRPGANNIELHFESPVRGSGTALTRFHDAQDGNDYVYSLLVPADASSLFPCLDQPDLKVRFKLTVITPAGWRVISNSAEVERRLDGDTAVTRFAETDPISTYLFAFAAGPFAELKDKTTGTRLFVRRSREERARPEADQVLGLVGEGVRYFSTYFERAFPFSKYDLVLIPELPYGGMEHAGATFLREDSVLFPFQPAAADLLRRAQLILHETAHQWFGDLVTMRWFDDLWLKEGFANFMAAKATAALLPQFDAWNAFRAVKLAAYRTDITRGTTAIRQTLANLSAAKSAYGNIVYSKAPAVLRQAEFFLGEEVFRRAVASFVAEHAYGAADWSALVRAFEQASNRNLQGWAQAWVERRGLPLVRLSWQANDAGRLSDAILSQQDGLGEGGVWPMRVQLVLGYSDGRTERVSVLLDGASTPVPALEGRPAPRFVFANDGDFGYGLFLLDAHSRDFLLQHIADVKDPFLRALLWDALWESVRAAELPPLDYLELALRELPQEADEVTAGGILARVQTVFRWYLSDTQQAAVAAPLEDALRTGMSSARDAGLRITWFRAFAALASTRDGLASLKHLLSGELAIPGVALSSNDRFRMIRRLLTLNDAAGEALLAAQAKADGSDDGRRNAYAAGAAPRDARIKREYFTAYIGAPGLAERWIEESLLPFNAVEQEALTLPWLEPALRALPELKRTHKIFFVNNWLAAFVGGQRGSQALSVVQRFVERTDIEPDLRLKVLETMDGLERTVRIRDRYAH